MDFKFNIGDSLLINEKKWIVNEIRQRYGVEWVYGLDHKTKSGDKESLSIETSSLETIMEK